MRRPAVKTERKGRIITLTDKILDTGGTDTVRFGRLHSGEIAQLRLWLANETSGPVVIANTAAAADARRSNMTISRLTPAMRTR
ncbi:MAG: hypothetical protein ACLRMJ_07315 [Alistipes finegoldii]